MAVGHETVGPGQEIASDWGNNVWNQSTQAFDSAADRSTQFPAPQPGAMTYLADVKRWESWDGSAWVTMARPVFFAGGSSTTGVPANTNYGVGVVSVTEGGSVASGILDGIRITKPGVVLVHGLFYIPVAAERQVWVGLSTDKLAVAYLPSGGSHWADRLTLVYDTHISTVPSDIVFGFITSITADTTFLCKGIWFPYP